MDILEILQEELLTNTLSDYLIAFVIIVLGILAIRVIEQMILRRLKLWAVKTNSRLDDALVKIGDRALIPWLMWLYFMWQSLTYHCTQFSVI
ncbi:hypothetical protein [Limnospira platensis]|uniref:hypothetical protein n=1 Tax=Limnospira platensis TaxID=118562 RepID=UPI0021AA3496|nr:hypothetical protein APLC1_1679 [Arthrospira platensis C1]